MTKKIIVHVHRQKLASNMKHSKNDPPIIVRRGKKTEYFHEVKLSGDVRVIHGEKPLSCGARVWMEADEVEGIR